MDTLAGAKAPEIVSLIESRTWESPILDVGGGAGALSRALVKTRPGSRSVLFELPEVLDAAKSLYPDPADWDSIQTVGGDFRTYRFDREQDFGLVMLSNFLHAYGPEEARPLLHKAVRLLAPGGLLLVPDYFPDRFGRSPQKGVFYDLNMMLNTFNGVCPRYGPNSGMDYRSRVAPCPDPGFAIGYIRDAGLPQTPGGLRPSGPGRAVAYGPSPWFRPGRAHARGSGSCGPLGVPQMPFRLLRVLEKQSVPSLCHAGGSYPKPVGHVHDRGGSRGCSTRTPIS